MKSPPFEYARAETLEEALELLGEAGEEAKLLAGGQSLVPLLVHRIVRPTHLVDIDRLEEHASYERGEDGLSLGALTRHADLERSGDLEGAEGLLAEAAAHVGHLPIRTRGTLGGSIAHADPAAELPVALLALDAEIAVRSASGERLVPAVSFFRGPFTTALEPGEAVVAVRIPGDARGRRAAFAEFAVRAGDFALASAAAVARVRDGHATDVRVVLGGVDATPIRARAAEVLLEGNALDADVVAEAARAAAAECDPAGGPTSVAHTRALVGRLVRDTLSRVAGKA